MKMNLTSDEIHHFRMLLQITGVREARDMPYSTWLSQIEDMKVYSRLLKRLRKAEKKALREEVSKDFGYE